MNNRATFFIDRGAGMVPIQVVYTVSVSCWLTSNMDRGSYLCILNVGVQYTDCQAFPQKHAKNPAALTLCTCTVRASMATTIMVLSF